MWRVPPSRTSTARRSPLASGWLLALGFLVVHAWLVWDAVHWAYTIYGDVTLYEWWARHGLRTGQWPVLDYDWVYPALALVPVVLPALLSADVLGYEIVWTAMIVLLNAAATVVLVRTTPRGAVAAWWWFAFLVALGPISIGRLDGVAAPLILVALVLATARPGAATAVGTAGAWIKIAPGAVVVAIAATRRTVRELLHQVVLPGAAVSAVVVGLALLGGAGSRALSVFGQQDSRTLQVESVAATWFSVLRLVDPSVRIEYNDVIFTYEVQGDAALAVADALDWLLPVAVVAIAALTWWSARRRPDHVPDVVLLSSAALLLALIVFNKVGSPQFVAWIGPPLAAAIALAGPSTRRFWWPPAVGVLVTALATQIVYPVAYGPFLSGEPWMVAVGALRNVALVVLLAGAVWRIAQLGLRDPALAGRVAPAAS
jgi:hypothetical protein